MPHYHVNVNNIPRKTENQGDLDFDRYVNMCIPIIHGVATFGYSRTAFQKLSVDLFQFNSTLTRSSDYNYKNSFNSFLFSFIV